MRVLGRDVCVTVECKDYVNLLIAERCMGIGKKNQKGQRAGRKGRIEAP